MPGMITPGGRVGDPTPVGTPGGKQNWVDKAGGLPTYIRMVAHALMRQGQTETEAIRNAIGSMKRWARGGGGVSAKVSAAAAAALAEFEAKAKGAAVSKRRSGENVVELLKAEVSPAGREMLNAIRKEFKFGRVPVGDITAEHVSRAARAATQADDPAADRPYYSPDGDMDEDDQKYIMQNASDDNLKVAWADQHRQHVAGYGSQNSRVQAHKAKLHIEKEQARRAKINKSAPKKRIKKSDSTPGTHVFHYKHGWIPLDHSPSLGSAFTVHNSRGEVSSSAHTKEEAQRLADRIGSDDIRERPFQEGERVKVRYSTWEKEGQVVDKKGKKLHVLVSTKKGAPPAVKQFDAADVAFYNLPRKHQDRTTRLTKREFEEAAKLVESVSGSVSKKSTGPKDELTMQGNISKVDNEKKRVFGWASVGIRKDGKVVIDKQKDFIDDPEEMENAAYNFVLHSRDGGEMHIRKGVSTLIESFVITPEKQEALGIPDGVLPKSAWWTGWQVHDDDVWKGIKSGKYKMFSVHGKGTRKRVEV